PVVDAHEPEREQQPDAQEYEQGNDEGTHWPRPPTRGLWSGPSPDDWRKTCIMKSCRWNPTEKLGISHARSSTDGYHIYRVTPSRKTHGIANICLSQRESHRSAAVRLTIR